MTRLLDNLAESRQFIRRHRFIDSDAVARFITPAVRQQLTAEVVQDYFAALKPRRVVRFEAANVRGLNFVLYDVLAGGASRSLRIDSQGKALALALLQMPIEPGEHLDAMRRPKAKEKT